jgi:hypothetical protein
MRVAEKFISINGECTRAGELAVFVRFTGCNLCCSYCDTKWANEPGCPFEEMSPEEICEYVRASGIDNVTLTGGEPLLQKDMGKLIGLLIGELGARVEIETNGSVDLRPYTQLSAGRPVFSMDYKLPSSGCEDRMLMENFDPAVAARVWQRVTKPPAEFPMPPLPPAYAPPPRPELGTFLARIVWLEATYRRLAGRSSGENRKLLYKLAATKQTQQLYFKGLCSLSGGCTATRLPPMDKTAPRLLLEQCYGWEAQLLEFCEDRRQDRRLGHIYSHLAQQQRSSCLQLLILLGRQK